MRSSSFLFVAVLSLGAWVIVEELAFVSHMLTMSFDTEQLWSNHAIWYDLMLSCRCDESQVSHSNGVNVDKSEEMTNEVLEVGGFFSGLFPVHLDEELS